MQQMPKIRIHELAKELNIDNKKVMEYLKEKKIEVKSHMSTLEENQEAGPVGSGEENTGGVDAQSENQQSAENTEALQDAAKENAQTADAGDGGQA